MNFERDYKDWIEEKRKEWIGKTVIWDGCEHKVIDVDYNGALLIDKKAQFTETTAVPMWMCK